MATSYRGMPRKKTQRSSNSASDVKTIHARLTKLEGKCHGDKMAEASLIAENNKLAAEIENLKATLAVLHADNDEIKTFLDDKQNKWIQVESKRSHSRSNPIDM